MLTELSWLYVTEDVFRFSASGGFKVCSDNSSSVCNITHCTSPLRTPHYLLPYFLAVCLSVSTHHASLYSGVMSCKSSVHIWDITTDVCWYLSPCCNLTPLPSFHISNPRVNFQRALTQLARYKHNVARLVQYRRKDGRKDRVWRRLKRFPDGSATCKIISSVCKVLFRSCQFSIWWISQNVLACFREMFGCHIIGILFFYTLLLK